ncbi:helix-turn-helix domain-containing protein [Nocardia sp. NPDC052001]|uniref:PucR family transcriptional regulator n=1 Tax=Nocardia sp. NPDC052001 TaxID=3154853 RepID=UPI0034188FB2
MRGERTEHTDSEYGEISELAHYSPLADDFARSDIDHRIASDAPILARLARISHTTHGVDAHTRESIRLLTAAILEYIDRIPDHGTADPAELLAPVVEHHLDERSAGRPLLAGFLRATDHLWRHATAAARPEDHADVIAFSHLLLRLSGQVMSAITEKHVHLEQAGHDRERELRRALCSALVQGAPSEDLAARAGITADHYDLLALHLATPEGAIPATDMLTTRRRIRIVRRALDELTGGPALETFDGQSGFALLPGDTATPDQRRLLARSLTEQLGVSAIVAECTGVQRDSMPRKARQTAEVAELARHLHRPAGSYRLEDLLLEYQLTRPGDARDQLAERILPLLDQPHLVEAMEAHVRFGADRQKAAASVHIHPNTYSYRLRRIAEVTGIDPADPHGSRLIAAALTVHHIQSSRQTDPQ